MKNNQLTAVLIALLFLSTAMTVRLIYKYNSAIHGLERLQAPLEKVAMTENLFNSLMNDTREYERTTRNPDMTRLLESFTQKSTVASKPATK